MGGSHDHGRRQTRLPGAIVDGGVRDTDRVLPQNFPVFVKYRSSNGMLGRFRISGWQIPVRIGEVDIFPGDIVFGDIDGIVRWRIDAVKLTVWWRRGNADIMRLAHERTQSARRAD
mgnify:CR=1 FL=1